MDLSLYGITLHRKILINRREDLDLSASGTVSATAHGSVYFGSEDGVVLGRIEAIAWATGCGRGAAHCSRRDRRPPPAAAFRPRR